MTGSKEHILGQIRTALGRSAPTVAPEPLPPFARPHASTELATQFNRELEKVGGTITWVETVEEIREHFQRLFPADEFPSVAVSNSEVLREVREWLVADNRNIVPPCDATLGITTADYALADTGTLVLVSGGEQHRLISLLPPVHVCFLDPSRIFASLAELLAHLQVGYERLPQAVTFITGPSRSADIELTITMGVHGPRALHVVLLPGRLSNVL